MLLISMLKNRLTIALCLSRDHYFDEHDSAVQNDFSYIHEKFMLRFICKMAQDRVTLHSLHIWYLNNVP